MNLFNGVTRAHAALCRIVETLRSPLLLAIRLYWGWQFAQTGLGKLRNQQRVIDFFTSLQIPLPALNAHLISGLEFFGGILLIVGLLARPTALLLSGNMLVAYWTADREALLSVFTSPDKFYAAAPYTFLFAALLILIFGPGQFALDALIARRFHLYMPQTRQGADAVIR